MRPMNGRSIGEESRICIRSFGDAVEFVTVRAATFVCLFAPLRGRSTRSLSDKTKGQHIWVGVNTVMPNLHSPTYSTVLVPRYTFYGPE